jgi:hypothetical protein
MPFFRFGSPVIPLGSAANPIVVDYSPQELATMVAVAEDKAGKAQKQALRRGFRHLFGRFSPACARCFIRQSNPVFQVTQSIMVGQFDKLFHLSRKQPQVQRGPRVRSFPRKDETGANNFGRH